MVCLLHACACEDSGSCSPRHRICIAFRFERDVRSQLLEKRADRVLFKLRSSDAADMRSMMMARCLTVCQGGLSEITGGYLLANLGIIGAVGARRRRRATATGCYGHGIGTSTEQGSGAKLHWRGKEVPYRKYL